MNKLLSVIVAAMFAVVSASAFAASHVGAQEKKAEKTEKTEKKAKSEKKAAPKKDGRSEERRRPEERRRHEEGGEEESRPQKRRNEEVSTRRKNDEKGRAKTLPFSLMRWFFLPFSWSPRPRRPRPCR